MQLIGVAAGLVTCLGITLPARVHLRAQTPLPGRSKDGKLVLINEGPGVRTLIARVRDPEAQLHRDISLTYMLAPGVILPLSALMIAGSLAGYDDLLMGGLYGLVAGLLFTLSMRHLRATWWALRHRGSVLDPRTVAPLLAVHAEVHGDHTVYGGVTAEEINATLAANPDLAANAADVCRYFGGRRRRWPGHDDEQTYAEPRGDRPIRPGGPGPTAWGPVPTPPRTAPTNRPAQGPPPKPLPPGLRGYHRLGPSGPSKPPDQQPPGQGPGRGPGKPPAGGPAGPTPGQPRPGGPKR